MLGDGGASLLYIACQDGTSVHNAERWFSIPTVHSKSRRDSVHNAERWWGIPTVHSKSRRDLSPQCLEMEERGDGASPIFIASQMGHQSDIYTMQRVIMFITFYINTMYSSMFTFAFSTFFLLQVNITEICLIFYSCYTLNM